MNRKSFIYLAGLFVLTLVLEVIPSRSQMNFVPPLVQVNCPDTGGNHLNFSLSTQVYSCGTSGGAGGGANAALSNLASVAVNTALLTGASGIDDGSTANPWRNIFFYGSGTYGSTYFKLGGTPTSTRTVTFPDATDTVVELTVTGTLTNKRITPRVTTAADATSITPNTDNADVTVQANTQAGGTLTLNNDTGTPTDGQSWTLRVKTTNSQTWSFGTQYVGSTDQALPTTTSTALYDYLGFMWNGAASKWQLVALNKGF